MEEDGVLVECFGSDSLKYSKGELIGCGAFGSVFKARIEKPLKKSNLQDGEVLATENFNENVAVKEINVKNRDMEKVLSEKGKSRWKSLTDLRHVNILPYYQIQIRKGQYYGIVSIAMEYVPGGDLASLLEKILRGEAKLNPDDMVSYITQLAGGLEYLHQQKIMHGDLKPANVLMKHMEPLPRWRLLIADLDDRAEMEKSVTQHADVTHIRGTARYTAPEMAARFLKQDPVKPGRKADVWSLGCIILDMANFSAGHAVKQMQKTFFRTETFVITEETTSGQILFKIVDGYVPVIPPSVPRHLETLIKGCICAHLPDRMTASSVNEYATALWKECNGPDFTTAKPKSNVSERYALEPIETALRTFGSHALETKGSATWLIRDAATAVSLDHTVIVASVRSTLDGVSFLEAEEQTATTNSFGEILLFLPKRTGLQLAVTFEMSGYYPITLRNMQLDANPDANTTFMEPLLFISRRFTGSGTATGTLRDVTEYNVIVDFSGIKLDFRSDMNSHVGSVVESVTTSAAGTWSVSLPGGHYTVTASKSGYITVPFTVVVVGGTSRQHGDSGISPVLNNGAIRIVSTGGNRSRNAFLPIHVSGPVEGKSERRHTYAFNGKVPGSFVWYEVSSWPLGSVLIEKQLAGIYRISISDWCSIYPSMHTSRSRSLWDMANFGGSVQLYTDNKLWAQYFMPNRPGNAWSVVEMNGTHLKTISEVATVTCVQDIN